MDPNLSAALQISLVGMSLVLASLALVWALLAVLVRLTADPETPPPDTATAAAAPASAARQRAAAVAVAAALALQASRQARAATNRPAAPPASAWSAVMRAQSLKQRQRHR